MFRHFVEVDVPTQILHCFYLCRCNIKEEVFIIASERYYINRTAIGAGVLNFCTSFIFGSGVLLLVDLCHIG